jgi:Domain of unknown function (DUF4372)
MNVGKTLFAQVMEYVPWKTFGRIIDRHGGDAGVRAFDCADLFRVMAFSHLTWRESLRAIESCMATNQTKLFHMGLSGAPARATLSDALNQRDWRIYHALATRLIVRVRDLYAFDPTGLEVDATVHALDRPTALFAVGPFVGLPWGRSVPPALMFLRPRERKAANRAPEFSGSGAGCRVPGSTSGENGSSEPPVPNSSRDAPPWPRSSRENNPASRADVRR